jgi:hypothetical protein
MDKILYDNKRALPEDKEEEPREAKNDEDLKAAVFEAMEVVLTRKEAQARPAERPLVLDPALARWIPPRKRRF